MSKPVPEWIDAAVDQRMALLRDTLGGSPEGYPIIMTTLTEPREDATVAEVAEWERTCDNCGTVVADGEPFLTGSASREWQGVQVIITLGACPNCAEPTR